MKRYLLVVLCALLTALPVDAKTLNEVAAVINTSIVTTYQLDQAVKVALARNAQANQMTGEQFDQLRQQILDQLINDELAKQRVKELGLQVPDPELNAAIEDVMRKNNLTQETLNQALAAQGMTYEGYRETLKNEILRYKLLNREVNYKVQVSRSEIRDYFREHIDEYRVPPSVRVSHISIKVPAGADQDTLEQLRKKADLARDQLLSGIPFDQVLEEFGSSASGGDMGELIEEDLSPQLRQSLTGLEVGQVSEPLLMNDQLLLFLITARNPGDSGLFDRVSGEIEEILKVQKTEARFKEWTLELREKSHIEIRI